MSIMIIDLVWSKAKLFVTFGGCTYLTFEGNFHLPNLGYCLTKQPYLSMKHVKITDILWFEGTIHCSQSHVMFNFVQHEIFAHLFNFLCLCSTLPAPWQDTEYDHLVWTRLLFTEKYAASNQLIRILTTATRNWQTINLSWHNSTKLWSFLCTRTLTTAIRDCQTILHTGIHLVLMEYNLTKLWSFAWKKHRWVKFDLHFSPRTYNVHCTNGYQNNPYC